VDTGSTQPVGVDGGSIISVLIAIGDVVGVVSYEPHRLVLQEERKIPVITNKIVTLRTTESIG
jgi:hypothetical protein